MIDTVDNINPVPLNVLTKRQLDGTLAIMTGRKNDVLSKITVNLLSDEDVKRNIRILRNKKVDLDDRGLWTFANPYVFLSGVS